MVVAILDAIVNYRAKLILRMERVKDKAELTNKINDYRTMGYKLKKSQEDSAELWDVRYGGIILHTILFLLSLGVFNVIYILLKCLVMKDVVLLKIDVSRVGEVVRLKTSPRDGSREYEVSVNKHIRGSEVYNFIKSGYSSISEPENGYEYLLIKVKVKYISGDNSGCISSCDFKVYCNNVEYSEASVMLPDSHAKLDSVELMPGDEISGWIVYEVPMYEDVLIKYTPHGSSSSCYFKLG